LQVDGRLRLLSPPTKTEPRRGGEEERGGGGGGGGGRDKDEGEEGCVYRGVFAMGDCAGDVDNPLPPLAQVAAQQAKYLSLVRMKKVWQWYYYFYYYYYYYYYYFYYCCYYYYYYYYY